jgi:hypothetical protein
MTYHKRTTCRLCDSTQLRNALHYPPQPLADNYQRDPAQWQVDHGMWQIYPLDLYLCGNCGCAQLLDVVSADEIYPQYTYETGSSPALVEHFRQYAIEVYNRINPRFGSLVVDIGSNDGTLLENFKSLDFTELVVGVDPAPIKPLGILTYPKFFDTEVASVIQQRHGPASIITANNVYANIDDLRTFTENVRNLLALDGVFVFETFYLADFIDNMVFDFIYHEHLTAFSLAPLIGFFQRLGMEVFDVQRVATKGGSIRVYVQHEGGKRPVSVDVPALVEWEYLRGLGKIETFQKFHHRIENVIAVLCKRLWAIDGNHLFNHDSDCTIAGYGASPTSTTLIYSSGIGKYLDYLIDDCVAKQGTFSPGLHLPVYNPETLVAKPHDNLWHPPDYCLILAWRYAEQIMARNTQYHGTWIVPLPELRVINAQSK